VVNPNFKDYLRSSTVMSFLKIVYSLCYLCQIIKIFLVIFLNFWGVDSCFSHTFIIKQPFYENFEYLNILKSIFKPNQGVYLLLKGKFFL